MVLDRCSATPELPVNYVTLKTPVFNKSLITLFSHVIKSNSFGCIPQCMANLKNYSITTLILLSGLKVGLFPHNKAAKICKAGISTGKLKGDMIATGPYGHLYPLDSYPA